MATTLASLVDPVDPYGPLAALRAASPVADVDGFVVVTGYDATVEVLHSSDVISGPIADRYRNALPPGAARDEMSHRINFLDPPDHPRVRRLVSKAFTPRRVTDLTPWIRHTAARLVDEAVAHGTFDVLDVAHVLPSLVISKMLGVPAEDRDRLTAWSDAVSPLLATSVSSTSMTAALDAAEEFHAYLHDLIDKRRRDPSDDLLTALITAEADGDRLTLTELLSLVATLYSAGHRTTRDSFTNGMAELLGPTTDGWSNVVDGSWTPAAVATEILRHQTPTLYVGRVASRDTRIGTVEVEEGAALLVFLGAANRDPEHYDDPDRFRPGRAGPPAMSFAHGAHYCLGASLATGELTILLQTFAEKCPNLTLVDDAISWHMRGPFRGVDSLVVES